MYKHIAGGNVARVSLCGERAFPENLTDYALDGDCRRCKDLILNSQLQRISLLEVNIKNTTDVIAHLRKWISENEDQVIDQILETGDGLLLLHHNASRS